jgi:N-ethylmaleimide reductase
LRLKNRIVMAPLTRSRAENGNIPSSMAPDYYSMRSDAGLIITEATQASAGGQGYVATPGIHTDECRTDIASRFP